MSEKPLSAAEAALADCLGQIIAQQQAVWERDWRLQMQIIVAESRNAILEIKAVAIEALLTANAPPEAVAKLRAIAGGRQ